MKRIYTVIAGLMLTASVFAQAPEKMSYQAVIRDASNNLTTNQVVGMQISILQTTATGTAVYVETQTPTTNANGLVSLEIGTGTVVSGTFATIDWANGPYFIKTETDPTGGTTYTITGTSQLMSVPYALHAKTASSVTNDQVDDADANPTNEIQALTISNDTIYLSNGGFVKLPPAAVGFSGSYNDLTNVPTDLADGDDDTQLDSTGVATLGFVAGAHTLDTDTHIDSTGIAGLGYVAGGITTETDPVFGASVANGITTADTANWNNHTVDTDTHIDSTGVASLGFVAGAHTVDTDTQLDSTDIANLGYVAGVTQVTAGTNVSVTGAGTTASPYVVNATSVSSGHYVGELFGGGIVFYVYNNGANGLIASLDDLDGGSGVAWSGNTTVLIGATAQSFYDGAANTTAMVTQDATANKAGTLCDNYTGGSQTDWYLPAYWELNLLYNSAFTINTILENDGNGTTNGLNPENVAPTYGRYWSSTENTSNTAWLCHFFNGNSGVTNKDGTYRVRAVRAF